MRNKIWVWLLLGISGTAFSQNTDSLKTIVANSKRPTQIGSVMVGGSLNVNFSSNFQQIGTNQASAGDKVNDYNFNGYTGFFTAPFLAFGGILYLNYQETRQSGNNLFTRNSYGIGAFARPYFYLANQIPILIHTEFTIGLSKSGSLTTTDTRIAAGPGIAYFFNRNVSLELLLLYRYTSSVYNAGNTTQVIDYSNNFNPTLGFQIYFHKK